MKRSVNKEIIGKWFEENAPDAVTELRRLTKIPVSSLQKIRSGRTPFDEERRKRIAHAIGVPVDELFPIVTDGEEQAS